MRVVHLELSWGAYEPSDGAFSSGYAQDARQRLAAMRAAGMKVVLGLGLQYPPSWVFGYPDSGYVDQYGNRMNVANLTWNAALRSKVERYLARVDADLDLNSFWAVRIGSGGNVETLYPGAAGRNAYWAYDGNAQARSPFPGWQPGQTTWNGQPFTTAQVSQWYDWYLDALVDGVDWQIGAYKSLGYSGYLQVLLPGQGVRPNDYAGAIGRHLAAGTAGDTMARGAVWDRVIARIADKRNVVAYVSSMADGSGGDDLCGSGDAGVAATSSAVYLWSATRWISYNANKYGLAKMGENPGQRDTDNYGQTMLERAALQMQSCGFQGLMWAHDHNLYDGTSGVSLESYGRVIASH